MKKTRFTEDQIVKVLSRRISRNPVTTRRVAQAASARLSAGGRWRSVVATVLG